MGLLNYVWNTIAVSFSLIVYSSKCSDFYDFCWLFFWISRQNFQLLNNSFIYFRWKTNRSYFRRRNWRFDFSAKSGIRLHLGGFRRLFPDVRTNSFQRTRHFVLFTFGSERQIQFYVVVYRHRSAFCIRPGIMSHWPFHSQYYCMLQRSQSGNLRAKRCQITRIIWLWRYHRY